METSPVFERTCQELCAQTSLSELEARGTIRLALKGAGLDARSVSTKQMLVVLGRVLPAELRTRGVPQPEAICEALAARVELADLKAGRDVTDASAAIFRRVDGR